MEDFSRISNEHLSLKSRDEHIGGYAIFSSEEYNFTFTVFGRIMIVLHNYTASNDRFSNIFAARNVMIPVYTIAIANAIRVNL